MFPFSTTYLLGHLLQVNLEELHLFLYNRRLYVLWGPEWSLT